MSLIDALRHRIRAALTPNAADRERDEEYAFHQTLDAQQRVHSGAAPEDARLAAKREFGNASYQREEARWMGITRWLDATAQDLRYGWRALLRSPAFSLVAVLSLGLGIGANALIFGTIQSLVLTKLPVVRPDELRLVSHAPEAVNRAFFTPREVAVLKATPGADFATLRPAEAQQAKVGDTTVTGVSLDAVDGAFFRIVHVRAAAGRLIDETDVRNASTVAVISHRFATTHFGSARQAPGKVVELNNVPFTIVGVTNARYEGLAANAQQAMTIPATALPLLYNRPAGEPGMEALLVTRIRGDSARTQAALSATFAACCASGELAAPGMRSGTQRIGFIDIRHGIREGKKINVREQYTNVLLALMGGVAVLLLITCTNVGNLLMARAAARGRELAVRLSLGASRTRIVRQLLVEAMLLAAIGGVAAITLAIWGSALLARNLPSSLGVLKPFVAIRPGLPIFAFTAAVTIACALVFGIVPALRSTGKDLTLSLRDTHGTTRRSGGFDRGLVAIQVGLALLLVSSAALLVATMRHLTEAVGGSNPETLIAVQLDSRGTPHSDTVLQAAVPELQRRFAAIPGVRSVAQTYVVPLIYGGLPTRLLDLSGTETLAEDAVSVAMIEVGPGYFDTMGIPLIGGRDFDDRDRPGAPRAAVISENLARQFFPGRDPLGQWFGFRGGRRDIQVVGVVADAKQVDLRSPAQWTVYLPSAQASVGGNGGSFGGDRAVFAVRTTVDPAQVIPAARAVILEQLPNIRIRHLHPMTELLSFAVGKERALAWLSVAFGVLAVVLAAVGLYGVMAFQVSARTREIGVRIALGAGRGRVVRMVVRQALVLVALGVAIGVPVALAGARSLGALLYGIEPFDPVPFTIAAAVLAAVGVLAALLPSRRAAQVDPLIAIRAD